MTLATVVIMPLPVRGDERLACRLLSATSEPLVATNRDHDLRVGMHTTTSTASDDRKATVYGRAAVRAPSSSVRGRPEWPRSMVCPVTAGRPSVRTKRRGAIQRTQRRIMVVTLPGGKTCG